MLSLIISNKINACKESRIWDSLQTIFDYSQYVKVESHAIVFLWNKFQIPWTQQSISDMLSAWLGMNWGMKRLTHSVYPSVFYFSTLAAPLSDQWLLECPSKLDRMYRKYCVEKIVFGTPIWPETKQKSKQDVNNVMQQSNKILQKCFNLVRLMWNVRCHNQSAYYLQWLHCLELISTWCSAFSSIWSGHRKVWQLISFCTLIVVAVYFHLKQIFRTSCFNHVGHQSW